MEVSGQLHAPAAEPTGWSPLLDRTLIGASEPETRPPVVWFMFPLQL